MQQLVLLVDDNPVVTRLLRGEFEGQGFRVLVREKDQDPLALVEEAGPNLVISEMDLNACDGLSFVRRMRERSRVPLMVLSSDDDSRHKVSALDLGADDYVTKPFDTDELLARARALLRRSSGDLLLTEGGSVDLGDVVIDLTRRLLLVRQEEVALSRTEWQLLHQLAINVDRVMFHRELLIKVWGTPFADDVQYLRVWVCRLRRKIGDEPNSPRYLITLPGVGYRLQRVRYPAAVS